MQRPPLGHHLAARPTLIISILTTMNIALCLRREVHWYSLRRVVVSAAIYWVATACLSAQPRDVALAPGGGHASDVHSADHPWRATLSRSSPVVTAMTIDPSGRWLATAGDDHQVRLWSLPDGQLRYVGNAHRDWVQSVAFSHDSQRLYSAGEDGLIVAWQMDTLDPSQVVGKQEHAIASLAIRPDGQLLTVGFRSPLRVYSTESGRVLGNWECPSQDMRVVTISPDGQTIAVGGRNGRLRIWSGDGTVRQDLRAHDQRLRTLVFSPDGQRLISAGEDRSICVWETATGKEIRHIRCGHGKILAAAMLDARRLATATSENAIEIWDVAGGDRLDVLRGHTGSVSALANHGDTLISGSYDATVRMWTLPQGGRTDVATVLDASGGPVSKLPARTLDR